MDARGWTIGPLYILIGFVLGLVGGYLYISIRPGRRKYLATTEYWVYLPGEKLPDQNEIMTRTVGLNPYKHRTRVAIGTAEGILFSDVRLHIALVLRSKNPHAFRPDLFDTSIEATPEMLQAMAEAQSFVKVRYVSEDPLHDTKHLQFLPHLADAVAELGDGKLIYDSVAERLIMREELQELLRTRAEVSGPDIHTRVIWRTDQTGGFAETKGLQKIGLPELKTLPTEPDQRVLVGLILQEVIGKLWTMTEVPESLEVSAFDDQFRVIFEPSRDKTLQVRILRIQTA